MSDAHLPKPLAPALARRIAPLALLAGLVVGVALPLTYRTQVFNERTRDAAVQASLIADRLTQLSELRPRLWPYDTPRLHAISAPVIQRPYHGHVRIDLAGRDGIFTAGGAVHPDDLTAWAPVRRGAATIARVEVRLPARVAAARTASLWLLMGALGVLLAAGLFLLPVGTVRRGDRNNAGLYGALQAANATLEERVLARTAELEARKQQLEELGGRLVAAQEEERARISRDLHDDLGQVLTGLRLQLTAAQTALSPESNAGALLQAALQSVDDGVEQVRTLAHTLRPAALDGLGVASAVRDHAERWAERAGLTLHLDLALHDEPPPDVASVIFRVAQEALTNVARHAHARAVHITLGPQDDGWQLTIDDDGRGLPDQPGRGLGLVGARERVEQAGGYLDLERSPQGGARLLAWLPPAP